MDQFKDVMQHADYILGPVKEFFNNVGNSEIYNVTKMTGIVTDMIEYSKPGIVPGYLKMPERLSSSTIYYQTPESLKDIIVTLLDHKTACKYAKNALDNSRKYALSNYLI